MVGKSSRPKTERQIIKWLQNPYSDSAEYRLWGNGVALPNVCFVLAGIVYYTQDVYKRQLFALLGKEWYSDSLSISDMKDKTAAEKLQGYWILELGELAGIKKVDVETVKSFVTRTDDKFRQSYGVAVESHPRSCIIVGSTNSEGGFLRDITGNRRFWPVHVSGPVSYTHLDVYKRQVCSRNYAKKVRGSGIEPEGD